MQECLSDILKVQYENVSVKPTQYRNVRLCFKACNLHVISENAILEEEGGGEGKQSKKWLEEKERKLKYMDKLLATAKEREQEFERRPERAAQREREKEGDSSEEEVKGQAEDDSRKAKTYADMLEEEEIRSPVR